MTRNVLLVLLISATTALTGAETPAAPALSVPRDPMAWAPPKERLMPRELLTGKDYEKRFADAAERAQALRKDFPVYTHGIRVMSVVPQSQAEKLGIQQDEYLVELDGAPVFLSWEFILMRVGGEQTVTVYSPQSRQKRVLKVAPGKLGVQLDDILCPLNNFYFTPQDAAPGAKEWNAAAVALYDEPALAETALFHALKKGVARDGRFDLALGVVLMSSGEADSGLASLWFANQAKPAPPGANMALMRAAGAHYKLKLFLECLDRMPYKAPELRDPIAAYVKEWDALQPSQRMRLSPREMAAKRICDPIPLRAKPAPDLNDKMDIESLEQGLRFVTEQRAVGLFAGTNKYQFLKMEMRVSDVVMKMVAQPALLDEVPPKFQQHYTVNLSAANDPEGRSPQLGFRFGPRMLQLLHPNPVIAQYRTGDGLAKTRASARRRGLEIYCVDGDVEMLLDGRRVMYGPLLWEKGVYPELIACGAGSKSHGIVAHELLTEAQAAERFKDSINTAYRSGYTRLHAMAADGDLQQIQHLLKLGADPKVRNKFGMTPAHVALMFNNIEALKVLQDAGTPDLVTAAALGDLATLRKLLSTDAKKDLNSGAFLWTPVLAAVQNKQAAALRVLLENGADPNRAASEPYRSETPLVLALVMDRIEEAKVLIENGADVNKPGSHGNTPLKVAQDRKLDAIVALLKAKNATQGQTPAVRPPEPPPGDF